ncbi:hypothetical protein ACJRO7_000135 [Eucalyptus globulus]|uniref:DUF4220 domain-containing protein n=1 Tax=Eucalyptus globulus TaxID=34317 RepID=A0ABD3LQU2_EUCGL
MAFSSISYLWNKWNIRGFVILSLLLQVFLHFFAPLRKKITNNHLPFLLWMAYLMANWVTTFAIGLISHNPNNSSVGVVGATEVDMAFRAFWTSFLLLHLGGSDNITAFSLEDNTLWRRHLFTLTFQVGSVIHVFAHIIPCNKSLVFPTMLVFLAGVIKTVEKILALNLSSLPRFKEWVLSQQDSLDDTDNDSIVEFIDLLDGYSHDEEDAKLAESTVVKHAYYFFRISKVFLTDLIFTRRQRKISQEYFRAISAMDALRVISVELNFIYEVLHTKALVIRTKWSYIFRFIAFTNIVMALVLFNRLKKQRLHKLDVKITFILLFGGITLDVIAVLMLIFSDWTIAGVKWYKIGSYNLDSFLYNLVSAAYDLRKPQFATREVKPNDKVTYVVLNTPLLFQRWSESISACNLLSESLKESPRKMYKCDRHWGNITFSNICSFALYMTEKVASCFHQAVDTITGSYGLRSMDGRRLMIANTEYVSTNPFIMRLWIFIFKEVRRKSEDTEVRRKSEDTSRNPSEDENAINTKKIYAARGDLFLSTVLPKINDPDFKFSSRGFSDYEDSIITWHIATEILYNIENPTTEKEEREFSKILSDYMLYLLLNQPNLVSAVAGIAQITLARTLWELQGCITASTKNVESLCKEIFKRPTTEPTKSLLDKGIFWARQIEENLKERKWEVMSGVWVEMLSYAATHINGETHVQVLSRGGELLAFVWLLMIHFGCFYRPEWGPYYGYRH